MLIRVKSSGRLVRTEGNNLAIKGAAHFYQTKGKHIITVKTEHKAVLDTVRELERQGFEATYLQPGDDGLITVAAAGRSDSSGYDSGVRDVGEQ
jgi:cysteine sulfinate desulfinase/cysteine desulfurase-like protein